MGGSKEVEEYIQSAPREARPKLRALRKAIRVAAPSAVERVSYGMPFYSFPEESGFRARLCYFGLLKDRIVFYTRPGFLAEYAQEASAYLATKSALHFPLDRPIPIPLVQKLVRNGVRKHGQGEDGSSR